MFGFSLVEFFGGIESIIGLFERLAAVSECVQVPSGGPPYLVPEVSKHAPSAGDDVVSLDLRDRRLRALHPAVGPHSWGGEHRGGTVLRPLRAFRRLSPLRLLHRIYAPLHFDGSDQRDDCRLPSTEVETLGGRA